MTMMMMMIKVIMAMMMMKMIVVVFAILGNIANGRPISEIVSV